MTITVHLRRWRHFHISAVSTWRGWWIIEDDQNPGELMVRKSEYPPAPRVGDAMSYYGAFSPDGLTIGNMIERLVIGERLVWDRTND